MQKNFTNFQSFLILGSEETRLQQRNTLLASLGLVFSASSPDVFYVEPKTTPTAAGNISIDEIRSIKKHIFQKPVSLNSKIIVITSAHKLTIEAQNAILKILEEPPKHAILILEAENEFQFLTTILSRVVKIRSAETHKISKQSFLQSGLVANLESLETPDQATTYLDKQIQALYQELLTSTKSGNWSLQKQLSSTIASCISCKKMIAANVNPRFVLANLFLTTQA